MQVETSDSVEFLKKIDDYGLDIIYCDPPYALGSEITIRNDGKVDYSKASDFMDKWSMPDGYYWESWFKEAFRSLKYGGRVIMFGMDRQLLLFKYYAKLAGFQETQSLYWYFISNFPKATDLSKIMDRHFGEDNVQHKGKWNFNHGDMEEFYKRKKEYKKSDDKPLTNEIAKKYQGYKYSISALKQTNETIMVFVKPTKTGSVLHDTLAYENGDETISVSALNIDGNRVGVSGGGWGGSESKYWGTDSKEVEEETTGRYPAQSFVDSQTAEILNKQSGTKKGSANPRVNGGKFVNVYGDGWDKIETQNDGWGDIGGCSKILHKCDYDKEDYDLYFYNPKVSNRERNAGCDNLEKTQCILKGRNPTGNPLVDGLHGYKEPKGNSHPTLKPIALNEKILKLFKTPNDQKICYAFAGAASEIIGGIKAGFDNWIACEINQEYVDIANARIKYWKETMTTQLDMFADLDLDESEVDEEYDESNYDNNDIEF